MNARPRVITDPEVLDILDGPVEVLGEEDLRPYQTWMADWMEGKPFSLLAAHMGLGKTAAVLRTVRRWLDLGDVTRVLIVAPLRVAEHTWPDEVRKWDFARPLSTAVMVGTPEERKAALAEDVEVHIINRENLQWLYREIGGAAGWRWDCLVYDEASRLGEGAVRTKPVQRKDGSMSTPKLSGFGILARVRPKFRRVVELSGTPAPNGLRSLWGPVYILDRGQRLGNSRSAFDKRWFSYNQYSKEYTPHEHSFDEITERISDVMVSLRKEDFLTSLPPVVVNDIWVDLPPKVMAEYRRLEREMILAEHDIEAVTSGVLASKLLQLANGSVYNSDGADVAFHDLKLQALESVVEEAAGEPMLISYSYKFDLARIKKRWPSFRVFGESKSDLRDWNAGRIKGLIVHPASAGHGMNFQYGGHIFCWYGLNWSLELYQQFNERLPRSGQKADTVYMHRILARKTYDERQLRMLGVKDQTQDAITNTVRVLWEDIRRQATKR